MFQYDVQWYMRKILMLKCLKCEITVLARKICYTLHTCAHEHTSHTLHYTTHTKQAKQSLWLILAVMSTQWETIQVLRVSARKSSLGSTGNLYHVSQMRVRAPKVAWNMGSWQLLHVSTVSCSRNNKHTNLTWVSIEPGTFWLPGWCSNHLI